MMIMMLIIGLQKTKGMEWQPERGKRCTVCFDMRFFKTAAYAYQHDYSLISSTLGISRWKDMNQINCQESVRPRSLRI